MKIARLDTLPRQDDIFIGGEPDSRYEKRQLIVVDDNYDFGANSATDVTDIEHLTLVHSWFGMNYVEYRDALIFYAGTATFSNLSDEEKKVLAKNFAVSKSDRDTVFSESEQKSYAKTVQESIDEANKQITYESNSDAFVDDSGVPDFTNSTSSSLFGSYIAEASSEGETSTSSSSSYQTKLILTTTDIPEGKYKINWYFEFLGATNRDFEGKIVLNDSDILMESNIESKDSSNWNSNGGFKYENLSGINTVKICFKPEQNTTIKIRRARIDVCRIS